MSVLSDSRELTGPEKVGVLLLALGKQRASELLRRFDPEELNIIVRSTEVMPTITAAELESIVEEFESKLGLGAPFVGRPEDVKRLLVDAIEENKSSADASDQFIARQDIWTRLSTLDNEVLLAYFKRQAPQVSAYYLDRLGSERASEVLKLFAPNERNDLMNRILGLGDVAPMVIEALEASLHEELFEFDRRSVGKHATMAGILNNLDKSESTEILTYLESIKPKDAEAIRKMLFKFEDLVRLPAKALTALMDGVPVERVVVALQGADPVLQQKVLGALSPRARRMAEAEMQALPSVSARDLAESRRSIVDAVLKLASEGAIDLTANAYDAI